MLGTSVPRGSQERRNTKHFKTSEKRLLVKVLESFPAIDFKANLVLSNSKAEDVKILLQFLDYNIYSRSVEHKKAVSDLRSNKLQSWEGRAKELIQSRDEKTLYFIAERPGMMIRMLTLLLRSGYTVDAIAKALSAKAESLSTQTLVTLLSHFGRKDATNFDGELHDEKEAEDVFNIVKTVFIENLKSKDTDLRDKKIYLDLNQEINLELSQLECNNKSPESGYLSSGFAVNIPEDVKFLRFFVYWNDEARVDLDLHTFALNNNGDFIHVGWNGDYKNDGIIYSGDITHSDAAEYIDVDLSADISQVKTDINVYYAGGKDRKMKNIDTVFVGMMGVNKIGTEINLYDPKNCFFTHYLKGDESNLEYGFIDVQNRVLVFKGLCSETYGFRTLELENKFNLKVYIDELLKSQNVTIVEDKENAEIVLTLEKTIDENGLSLIDNNFYLD